MQCPKCTSISAVKSGKAIIKGVERQRYHCKDCGCHYTQSHIHGYTLKTKLLACWLYLHGMSYRNIEKLLGCSNVVILKWMKEFGDHAEQAIAQERNTRTYSRVIELDEMWHYLEKKDKNSGFGSLWIEIPVQSLLGISVVEARKA